MPAVARPACPWRATASTWVSRRPRCHSCSRRPAAVRPTGGSAARAAVPALTHTTSSISPRSAGVTRAARASGRSWCAWTSRRPSTGRACRRRRGSGSASGERDAEDDAGAGLLRDLAHRGGGHGSRPGRACPWARTSPGSAGGARGRPRAGSGRAARPRHRRHARSAAAGRHEDVRSHGSGCAHSAASGRRRWRAMRYSCRSRSGAPSGVQVVAVPAPSGPRCQDGGRVVHGQVQQPRSSATWSGSTIRTQRLHAAVEVAVHEVRRAEEHLRALAVVREGEHACVLQEPAQDGAHPDGLATVPARPARPRRCPARRGRRARPPARPGTGRRWWPRRRSSSP